MPQQPQQQQTTLPKPTVSQSLVNGHADPLKVAMPPLTVVSDLPTGMVYISLLI